MSYNYTKIFEEAFSTQLNRTVFINEMVLPLNRGAAPYQDFGTLLCPECHSAELSVVRGKTPYFRTKIGEEHDTDCNFLCLPITERVFNKYATDENNCAEFARYLKEFLEMLSGNHNAQLSKISVTSFSDAGSETNTQQLHSHRILRKNFNNGSLVNDLGKWKLFYGQGYFKRVGDLSFNNQLMQIISASSNKPVCSLIISQEYLQIINDNFAIEESKRYNIAFFSQMKEKCNQTNRRIKYYNGEIVFPEHLFAQEVSKECSSAKSLR